MTLQVQQEAFLNLDLWKFGVSVFQSIPMDKRIDSDLGRQSIEWRRHAYLGMTGSQAAKYAQKVRLWLSKCQQEMIEIKCVHMHKSRIFSIPEEIMQLDFLEEVIICDSRIRRFDILCSMSQLKVIVLNKNNIERIPKAIGKLHGLESICLSENKITKISKLTFYLKNLKELDLSKNAIKQLPVSINQMNCLEAFFLDNNEIEKVPVQIGSLVSLKILSLNDNKINNISDEVSKLVNLEEFYIDSNFLGIDKINLLFEKMSSLNVLKEVALRNNKLEEVPQALLHLKNLKVLDLSENLINHISQEFLENFKVARVDLSCNPIEDRLEDASGFSAWRDRCLLNMQKEYEN
ncbi:MAG: leucine-rich repeat domain-containing protein [Chlamydiota bacterium]